MGSIIEINDTLKIKSEHLPTNMKVGNLYDFEINDRRIFHLSPVRVFLVEEIEGKWNYIGHAQIIELTINANSNSTKGKFILSKIYDKEYCKLVNINEPPEGKGFLIK
jgi:hypothetical protein